MVVRKLPRFGAGRSRLLGGLWVALSLIWGGSPRAWADPPSLGPMAFLPGDDAIGPAAGDQFTPAVARGGDVYLAVWQDDRGNSQDIYATRLDAGGHPIEAVPFVVSQAAGMQTMPRVSWNGTNWLVTWQSQLPTQFYYAAGIQAVWISPQGQILDPAPITVLAYQNSSEVIYGLANDGTNWAIVSEGTSAGEAAIRGVRVAPDGVVLDPGGVIIVPETYYLRFGIELGGLPGEYLLVWNEWRSGGNDDILAFRLTPALAKIESSALVIAGRANYEDHAKVSSNGTGFFVAWDLNDNYLSSDVYGARVSFGGQVLDPNGKAFSNAGYGYGRNPSVAWDGTNWIATWPNYGAGGLNAGRMTPQGTLLDPGGVSMPTLGWGSIADQGAGGFFAAWSDASIGSQDVFTAPVTGGLVPGAKACVSLGAPRQSQAALVFNGEGYLAVFLSSRSEGSRILGQRLDAAGHAIDPEPFEIVGTPGTYGPPSLAWDGTRYLVAYAQQGHIYARRVAVDGTMLDPAPILVMNGLECGVAALNGLFLVVGNYAPGNPQYVFVFGTRIRGSDATNLDPTPISIGPSFAVHPKVAMVGNRWLATWEAHSTHDDPHAAVAGNFVDGGGVAGNAFSVSAGLAAYNLTPALAANPDTALVTWSEAREGSADFGIYGRRILSGGALLDAGELALSTAPNSQTLPAVGWDGTEFVSLFQDPRNIPYFFDEHLDVYATRVTAGGLVVDPSGFAVANDPVVSEIQPAVAGGGGSAALACAIYRSTTPLTAFRIGIRMLGGAGASSVQAGDVAGDKQIGVTIGPNPSGGSFEIHLRSGERRAIRLAIFDLAGREVGRIYEGSVRRGETLFSWDGRGRLGQRLPRGTYFARLEHAGGTESVKLTLR